MTRPAQQIDLRINRVVLRGTGADQTTALLASFRGELCRLVQHGTGTFSPRGGPQLEVEMPLATDCPDACGKALARAVYQELTR